MSTFLRLLTQSDKAEALVAACNHVRMGKIDPQCFEVTSESFDLVPAKPFAYWAEKNALDAFGKFPAMEKTALATSGTGTLDDFRFLRCWWEAFDQKRWLPFAKGGAYSPFYYDHHLIVCWANDGAEMKEWIIYRYGGGHWARNIRSTEHYFRPGLTWPRRTQGGLSLRAMPAGCIFADKGPAAFVLGDDFDELLALLALTNSRAFGLLVSLQMAFGSYEVGVIQRTPVPSLTVAQRKHLASLARSAWSLKRTADSVTETSHAFVLPAALCAPTGSDQALDLKSEIDDIHAEIDAFAFDLYGFAEADREAVDGPEMGDEEVEAEEDDEEIEAAVPSTDGLLSWAVGVAFGRFDLRIATGERSLPPEPNPFDPLPTKAPGMLPDGAQPFHAHEAILVDEQGHPHDLVHLIEEALGQVKAPVPDDVRRWLRKEFFAFHLKLYSKSRRKAPIYWPLSTASGSYTLWLYYQRLSSQTLYTAINDFIEPKLTQIGSDLTALRNKGAARSRDDEKQFETLQSFELELIELRDTLLKLAPVYKPNLNDGVQISAAPLWPLFRHKPWQKLLKDTWIRLEKGNYDWAHLAINNWPERVRGKCKADKSLAIAHGLEALFVESKKTIEGATT